MIQLNLLPDVKLEYIKAQQTWRRVLSLSILVTGISVALLVLLLMVNGLNKKHLSDLNKDIATESAHLKAEPQIGKVLTVQNQLISLTSLHDGKPAATRTFSYLNSITPASVSITSFTIDFTTQKVIITGTADSLSSVNKYADTLKFTTFAEEGQESSDTKAFSDVVLTSFGIETDKSKGAQAASYSITTQYDPAIFDITKKISLQVPRTTTTRSAIAQPTDLFQGAPASSSEKKE